MGPTRTGRFLEPYPIPFHDDASAASPAVTAIGSVKYVLNVGGLGEANASLNYFSKPTDWNQDPRTICQMRTESLASVQQATISMVAPGIAEALIATALGLFAAIPAVIAYNRFITDIGRLMNRFDAFEEEFTNILIRQSQQPQQRTE